MSDGQSLYYDEEIKLLRQIASLSSDLVKANYDMYFCRAIGGFQKAKDAHQSATRDWEKWCDEGCE